MTPCERVVYQAFNVPDVLADENQPKAAGAALLELSRAEVPPDRCSSYQALAEQCIAAIATMLESHLLDPAIGEYPYPGEEEAAIVTTIVNRLPSPRPGFEIARSLVEDAVGQLRRWLLNHPDAIKDLSVIP